MDILGSIMKSMVQPPRLAPEEKERRKKAEEAQKKLREAEQVAVLKFKDDITKRILEFNNDELLSRLTLEPMTRKQRGIVHEIAEDQDLTAHSFGEEEVDRHVMLFKSEDCPNEAELSCLKRGDVYVRNSGLRGQEQEGQDGQEKEVEEEEHSRPGKRKRTTGQPEYLQKYEKHLGGLDVAKAGAKRTETSRSYGCVSSEHKKDKRTIEETLADIKSRKQQGKIISNPTSTPRNTDPTQD